MLDFRDRVRGCLVAGAAGDALGYAVEFMRWDEIKAKFGPQGIQRFELDPRKHKALISDDTQMTLFTAEGLLLGEQYPKMFSREGWIYEAYRDWLDTQYGGHFGKRYSRLMDIEELYAPRAPGGTCLRSLRSGEMGSVDESINNSKGCGGVMRVAPVACYGVAQGWDLERTVRLGAEAAAITHGHSMGWLPAAALVDIVYHVLEGVDPESAVMKCMDEIQAFYPDNGWLKALVGGLRKAVELAHNELSDEENIPELGEGWVGDEALYIAVYCAVKYADDLEAALIASVNHDGDSDSTGAVMGNILGAWLGFDAMDDCWKHKLELRGVILRMADDLCVKVQ